MLKTIIILFALMSVSACSSQGMAWLAEQVADNVSANTGSGLEYDEAEIFPSSNQRLACQMNAQCRTPLTENEFRRLNTGEKLLVLYGEEPHAGQSEPVESFVPIGVDYENYLRRQTEALEQDKKWRSVVFRDPGTLTQPVAPEFGDIWR